MPDQRQAELERGGAVVVVLPACWAAHSVDVLP
jgi:hypothetical protein